MLVHWAVICSYCGATVAVVPRIGDEEAKLLNVHLRTVHPEDYELCAGASAPEDLSFSEVLRHCHVSRRRSVPGSS